MSSFFDDGRDERLSASPPVAIACLENSRPLWRRLALLRLSFSSPVPHTSCPCLEIGTDFTVCKSSQGHFNKQVAFFIFGDSLVDPGNNYINTSTYMQANFWPYGESYFNPPTGRFSDGRIIPDFIAEFAGLPFIPAYLDPRNHEFVYGANFASAGAGALVDTFAGLVVNLKTQLQYFGDLKKQFRQNLGDAKAEQLLSDAVYLLSCNGIDYKNHSIYPYTHEQFVGMVIGNLTQLIKGIHGKGGRKFGIFDVPRIGCFPGNHVAKANLSCNEEYNIIISLHNQMFSQKLKELENQLEGFMYAEFDFWTAVNKRMENPSEYGFKVGDTACCGSGPFRGFGACGRKREIPKFELCENVREYLFFDAFHPNEVACRQFAEMFWNGDSSVTSPYNLKDLFQGNTRNDTIVAQQVFLLMTL